MDRIVKSDYEGFAEVIDLEYHSLLEDYDEPMISIIGKYEDIRYTFLELVKLGYDVSSIENFGAEGIFDYDDEYELNICEYILSINQEKYENEYLAILGDTVYVFDDCNSRVLYAIEVANDEDTYEVHVGEDDAPVIRGNYYDFPTISVSVNGKEITDKDEQLKYAQKFLLDYCERMDEYNNLLSKLHSGWLW